MESPRLCVSAFLIQPSLCALRKFSIERKEISAPLRLCVFIYQKETNKSELFGTMRNSAEPCRLFRFPRVVSLHCLSDTENMDYGNPSLDYGPASVDYGSP